MTNPTSLASAAGLTVKDLAIGYEHAKVLEHLHFALPPTASLAIVGESGCGKTTLLTTLAGLLPNCGGSLAWTDSSGEQIHHLHSSFVWQHLGLLPWKTVQKNLALPFQLKDSPITPAQGAERVAAMIDELGLKGLEKRWPASLSGGQRQRLALGRALIADPSVLFMDEPFSALDALRRERLQDFLAGLRRRRPVTMIFVTHDIPEAVFLSSHILLLGAHPSRQIELYVNPAWRDAEQCADRDSREFYNAIQHIHTQLRQASTQGSAPAANVLFQALRSEEA